MSEYMIGEVTVEELSQVSAMVKTVFDKFNAAAFSAAGIQSFYNLIDPAAMQNRLAVNSFMFVARQNEQILGAIEIYYVNHILLLFTAENWHGCGIAKSLLTAGSDKCRREHPDVQQLTVGAFQGAVPVYHKLGFVIYDQEQMIHDIRFTPMLKKFS